MLMVIIHIFLFLITTSRSQEASMASRLLLLLQQPQRRRPKISWAIGILALSQLGDRTPLWKKKEKAWMLCIPCIFNECDTYFVTVLQECTSTFILLFQAYFYKFGFLDYLEIREKKTSFPPHLIIFCFRSFVSYLGEEWKEKFSQWKNFLKILCSNIIGLTKNAVSANLTMKPTQKRINVWLWTHFEAKVLSSHIKHTKWLKVVLIPFFRNKQCLCVS